MALKWLLLVIAGLILVPACSSSQTPVSDLKKKYPDLIQLSPPEKDNIQESKIYIDSVRIVTLNSQQALLISGDLPDGCTHVGSVSYNITETVLSISLDAWRDPDMICTQALVSFSFIYRGLPEGTLTMFPSADLNGKTYSLTNN